MRSSVKQTWWKRIHILLWEDRVKRSTESLFATAQRCKQFKCLTDKWVNKMWCTVQGCTLPVLVSKLRATLLKCMHIPVMSALTPGSWYQSYMMLSSREDLGHCREVRELKEQAFRNSGISPRTISNIKQCTHIPVLNTILVWKGKRFFIYK